MKKAEIKDRIKEAMEIREIKQTELVEKTGIDKGQMSSYLSGKYKPKQRNINLIAQALFVDEAWLMGYDVPMEGCVHGTIDTDDNRKTTAKRIQLALSNSNMIPQELADKSGIGKASISQYVNGSHSPGYISAQRMGKVLNVNSLWLMGFDAPMNPEYIKKEDEDLQILQYYNLLNDMGKRVATERVKELTEVSRYVKKDFSYVNAAHAENYDNAPEELKQAEEDMIEKNFSGS